MRCVYVVICVLTIAPAHLAQQVESNPSADKTLSKSAATAPVKYRCELAVIGDGSGGFAAALSAARLGVDVILVELPDVPPDQLRAALRQQHVQLEHPRSSQLQQRLSQ